METLNLIQFEIAQKYPRNIDKIKKDIINVLKKENIDNIFYKIPRKDKNNKLIFIEGLSIKFAEILISIYKNIKIDAYIDKIDDKFIFAKANIIDFENNTNIIIDVCKTILDKNNNKLSNEQITLLSNSAISIAIRNAIYKLVPSYLINDILIEIKNEIKNNIKNNFEKIKNEVIDYFDELKIKQKVYEFVEINNDDEINEDVLYNLYCIKNSIVNNEIDKNIFLSNKNEKKYTKNNNISSNNNNINNKNNNNNNKENLIERFKKALELFEQKGVSKEVIYEKFNIKSEQDVNLAIIVELINMYKAMM